MPLLEFGPQIKDVKAGPSAAAQGIPGHLAQPPDMVSPCPCIETFTRTEAADELGVSEINDVGWVIESVTNGTVSVDGTKAKFDFSAGSSIGSVVAYLPIVPVSNSRFEMLALIRADRNDNPGTAVSQELTLGLHSIAGPLVPLDPDAHAIVRVNSEVSGGNHLIDANLFFREQGLTGQGGSSFQPIADYPYTTYAGLPFWIRYRVTGNTAQIRGWMASGSEPAAWDYTYTQAPTQAYENSSGLMDRVYLTASGNGGGGAGTDMIWYVDYIEVIAGIWCCASAPSAGQYVSTQSIGYGNGTAIYHVPADAYAPGSLRVWVDGLEQTAGITESDPTTGEFTLGFTPDATEQISVFYKVG